MIMTTGKLTLLLTVGVFGFASAGALAQDSYADQIQALEEELEAMVSDVQDAENGQMADSTVSLINQLAPLLPALADFKPFNTCCEPDFKVPTPFATSLEPAANLLIFPCPF